MLVEQGRQMDDKGLEECVDERRWVVTRGRDEQRGESNESDWDEFHSSDILLT
jgi:hypothetical protein